MATYDPIRKAFLIPADDMDLVATYLLHAMCSIRNLSGLPMDKYKRDGLLNPSDHAQRHLIDVATRLGIDLGGQWGNEIDLREFE